MLNRNKRLHPIVLSAQCITGIIMGLAIATAASCSTTPNSLSSRGIYTKNKVTQSILFTADKQSTITDPAPIPSLDPTMVSSPSPSPAPSPTPDNRVDELLAEMTVSELVGQTILVGINGKNITSQTCSLIKQLELGGIFYRSGNVETPWQLREFSSGLQNCADQAGIEGGLLIAIDHEGQFVYRFDEGATRFPMPMAIGATGDPTYAYRIANSAGQELDYSGINMIFGPVLDVLSNPDNSVISIRAFGGQSDLVSNYASMTIKGYQDAGILAAAKHFPGHGSVSVDSHDNLPIDHSNIKIILSTHLPAFRTAIANNVPAIMVGHVSYPALDESGLPASISEPIIQGLLKTELGFNGIVMTDALGMGALSQGKSIGVEQGAVEAINAGIDIVLVPSPYQGISVHNRILDAINTGEVSIDRVRDAARRVLQVKVGSNLSTREHIIDVPWDANRALSKDAGESAITIVLDSSDLIPVRPDWHKILLVCLNNFSDIGNALESTGHSVDFIGYSLPIRSAVSEGQMLTSLPARAEGYDGVIVCTYDSHLLASLYSDTSQIELIQGILGRGIPLIIVALKSPFDILDYPAVDAYISSFGTTPGQISGISDALTGTRTIPFGILPVDIDI